MIRHLVIRSRSKLSILGYSLETQSFAYPPLISAVQHSYPARPNLETKFNGWNAGASAAEMGALPTEPRSVLRPILMLQQPNLANGGCFSPPETTQLSAWGLVKVHFGILARDITASASCSLSPRSPSSLVRVMLKIVSLIALQRDGSVDSSLEARS